MKFSVVPEPSERYGDGDGLVGQVGVGVVGGDGRVVPGRDLALEDLGERVRRQLQLVDAVEVVRDGDRGEDGREVEDLAALELGQVLVLDEAVGAGAVDDLVGQVLAALARAAAAVVDGDARRRLLERGDGLLVEGLREGGAGGVQRGAELREVRRRARRVVAARPPWSPRRPRSSPLAAVVAAAAVVSELLLLSLPQAAMSSERATAPPSRLRRAVAFTCRSPSSVGVRRRRYEGRVTGPVALGGREVNGEAKGRPTGRPARGQTQVARKRSTHLDVVAVGEPVAGGVRRSATRPRRPRRWPRSCPRRPASPSSGRPWAAPSSM